MTAVALIINSKCHRMQKSEFPWCQEVDPQVLEALLGPEIAVLACCIIGMALKMTESGKYTIGH